MLPLSSAMHEHNVLNMPTYSRPIYCLHLFSFYILLTLILVLYIAYTYSRPIYSYTYSRPIYCLHLFSSYILLTLMPVKGFRTNCVQNGILAEKINCNPGFFMLQGHHKISTSLMPTHLKKKWR